MKKADLVIIGGGPAGISAAVEGIRHNLDIVLIEDCAELGGKVLKKKRVSLHDMEEEKGERKIRADLHTAFESIEDKITLHSNSDVWSVNSEKIVEFYSRSSAENPAGSIQAKKILIANGAVDRIVPFPGWHLPGVFTIGGLNTFVKRGTVPGNNVIVSGTGPLQVALLNHLVKAGVNVTAAVDPNSMLDMPRTGWSLLTGGGTDKLIMGMKYLFRIKKASVPFHYSHIVTRVIGEDRVEGAVISKVDSQWKPISGTEREVKADIIATGYNLLPNTDIARLIGCSTYYNEAFGHQLVKYSDTLETSIKGVFVAGDGAAVKGFQAAIDEGRLAALEIARQLGGISEQKAGEYITRLQRKLSGAKRIGKTMCEGARPRLGLLETVTDETIVCRCEDVTYGDIKTAVVNGSRDLNDLKRRTRLGMGNCQGTFCGQVANELMWKAAGETYPRTGFTIRQPVRPVPIGVLADVADETEASNQNIIG